ncbi:MAG: hypothetical protein HC796_11380 [Synechococcaceae cyanobacterium RL_1_2]|nr:hypothetical protein [Synechococcaceae cyanobacterium RL_1_2]
MDLEARTEAIGKRGMIILRKVADLLSYERTNNDLNCLYIKKIYRNEQKAISS